jgi:peptide/nickel transport system ATP-binding protein
MAIPPGCPFQTRCPRKIGSICETKAPPDRTLGDGHRILCHIPAEELSRLQSNVFLTTEEAVQ